MLKTFNDPDLFKKVIIVDVESWEYGYDIETKALSSPNRIVKKSQDRKKHIMLGQI